ncbi:MAG: hypothetical protein ACREX0_10340 [Noviherbaspirillum sp.]
MSKPRFTWQSATARALIGALGGLVLAYAFVAGSAGALVAAGWMTRVDAVITAGMLAFLVWVSALLVAFGAATVLRAAGWVLGGAVAFALLGWLCLGAVRAA